MDIHINWRNPQTIKIALYASLGSFIAHFSHISQIY